ncbi:TPA: phage antirepressor KilAC domain-containing protein [Salmonella enterica subsp. enterica serovar Litchfield]|nr:phage antirepressor Ant [Salmonella enterica subsp. enterica serovar Thompson]ECY7946919.1 phage antirepressor Ant [Salmonella enterica subsp. enterica serovar Thompson]
MKTSLITREEMIRAIEEHTTCISTRDIPSVVANYLMITKQLYRRKDKNAVNRILLSEIREYLVEQGRIPYAVVAADKRKEANEMQKNSGKTYQSTPMAVSTNDRTHKESVPEVPVLEWECVRVVTTETLASGYGTGEANIRKNLSRNAVRFIEGIHIFTIKGQELKNLRVTNSHAQISNKARSIVLWTEKGAARMSKIVDTDQAWAFFEKLENRYFRQNESPCGLAIPQSLPEALRLAAELAEQKEKLEQKQLQLEAELHQVAPKVEFADRVATASGILIGNYAKVIGLKQNFLFRWLRENKILIASGSRRNVPRQQYIDQGYFSVREVVIDDEQHHRIALTTHITGKGQQWLTRRLLEHGLLKTIANTPN